MKKSVFFSLLMFAAMSYMTAQTVVFSDNFDSYTVGSHLAQSNSAWTTWSNAPGGSEDGVITSDQANSAPNSLLVSGSVDQVYPFGNYTTGHYTVSFNMYIPSSGQGGYFNIQHVLLQQWCFACYFYNTGNGYLRVGGDNINFNYPSDAWFPVVMDVNMDEDQASLSINNVVINSWPFHYTKEGTSGVNQLAGIDLYAGSPVSGASGTYYVDDFVVTEISAALIGEFSVATEDVTLFLSPGDSPMGTVTMTNPGNSSTDFQIIPVYDIPNPNPASTGETQLQYYQGNPVTFLGWDGGSFDVEMAICIPASSLGQHIGKTLNEVHVFMFYVLPTAKVHVYAMGNPVLHPGPGVSVYEQTFVPESGWNSIPLTTPYLIDGSDLWFGIEVTQPEGQYMIPLDGHQANDYSNWYKRGSNWQTNHNAVFDFNFCLGGKIDGTPINPWLSVTPSSGSIDAGDSVTATVTVDTTVMDVDETYSATLHCFSSDMDNGEVIVPVNVSFATVSVNELNQIEVTVFPNPATDYVQVSSDVVERVEIYNMLGQKVFDCAYRDSHVAIPTSGMVAGTYLVTVTTNGTQVTKKVIVR